MRRLLASSLCLLATLPALAAGQDAEPTRAEQIEILRRILASKLQRWETRVAEGACAQCHSLAVRRADEQSLTTLDFGFPARSELQLKVTPPLADVTDPLSVRLAEVARISPHDLHAHLARPADVEGAYLKGYGVVYTVTLPPAPLSLPTTPAPATPLSDWERMRQELHGAPVKPQPRTEAPPPSLRETILQVLAENGKHCVALRENENITVIVTFRPDLAAHHSDVRLRLNTVAETWSERIQKLDSERAKLLSQGYGDKHPEVLSLDAQVRALKQFDNGKGPSEGTADKSKTKDEYELLGDLLVRQGKAQEASDAYKRALQALPASDRTAGIYRKLAQAYLQKDPNKNAVQAQEALAEALKLQESLQKPAAPPTPAKLPAKLIITAPVSLLKAVGAGKMTWDEFKKTAHVEQVK